MKTIKLDEAKKIMENNGYKFEKTICGQYRCLNAEGDIVWDRPECEDSDILENVIIYAYMQEIDEGAFII